MTVGSDTLTFTYDASGRPLSVTLNGTTYYYVTNLQGDVTAILNSSGTAVVNYTYDAWGNPLTVAGDLATTLGTLNPLRYRGYVYDTETGIYYVSSRYYDLSTSRFLNADILISTGQGMLGNNMFAYCRNNPVIRIDITGTTDAEYDDWDCNPTTDEDGLGKTSSVGQGPVPSATVQSSNPQTTYSNAKTVPQNSTSSFQTDTSKSTKSGFRAGLQKQTGESGDGMHAHHVFPKFRSKDFKKIGIDNTDPKYGAWWEAKSHLKNAREYNLWWDCFFEEPGVTSETAKSLAEFLAKLFGFEWNP